MKRCYANDVCWFCQYNGIPSFLSWPKKIINLVIPFLYPEIYNEICLQALSRNLFVENPSSGSNCLIQPYESGGDTWDHNNHKWSAKKSSLCTYRWYNHNASSLNHHPSCMCKGYVAYNNSIPFLYSWKCQRPGHLADDCLAFTSISQSASSGETCSQVLLFLQDVLEWDVIDK